MANTIYCCKKWVNGVLKKYMSSNPCAGGGAVECSAPDPPKPPGDGNGDGNGNGGGTGDCFKQCKDQGITPRTPEFLRCMNECHGRTPPPPPEGDCRDECRAKGLKPGTPDFVRCLVECKRGRETTCSDNDDCPDHQDCVDGKCKDRLPVFDCKGDEDCPPGLICDRGKCRPKDGGGDGENPCEEGGYQLTDEVGFGGGGGDPNPKYEGFNRSGQWQGGWMWHVATKKYYQKADVIAGNWAGTGVDYVCKKFHERTVDGEGGVWCCPGGSDFDDDGDGAGGPGGEFQWGEGLQDLLARIMERANYLLDYPRGLTPQERQATINYAIEGVKAGEAGEKQSMRDEMSRIGMSGSGFQVSEIARIERERRQAGGDVRRELAIDDLSRRFSELMGTTGMAQGLTGTVMQGEQIPEILSAARRSEGSTTLSQLIALLGGQSGSAGGGGGSSYWQAILAQLMGGDGGGGGGVGGATGNLSWLYYLPYLFGQGGGGQQIGTYVPPWGPGAA